VIQTQTGVRVDNDPGPADRTVPPPETLAKELLVSSATLGDWLSRPTQVIFVTPIGYAKGLSLLI
jgi:hypothetical protein